MSPGYYIRKNSGLFLLLFFIASGVVFPALLTGQKLASNNSRAIALYKEGQALADKEKLAEAMENFRQAMEADPNFVQAHLRYMDAARSLNRWDEVVQAYRDKVTKEPQSALNHFLYGRMLDDPSAKRAEYKAALDVDSTYYWAQFGIGGSYMIEDRSDEAIIALNKALWLNPQMAEAMVLLGTIYMKKGMPIQASQQFLSAAMLDSTDAGTFLRLGQVYSQLEKYETAEKYFLRAAEISPNEPLVYYYIGLVCELGGNPDRALAAYNKFLGLAPQHQLAAGVRKTIEKLNK